ncbi:DNA polymerase III subunit delta [Alteromonas halophila]|uniref:DNA polymerase III subunit delta n=1 Tax=Alteromonas halophila TaxID=516698 RepID=A0A918JHD7_9ALTE|nr:DNA polymerase III subunit delta [Alteromonas halophila]GGW77187.1 DNA polymerase III subunit delta [Alteromonas halophila]
MQVYPNRFNDTLSKGLKPCYLIFGDEPQQKFEIIEALRSAAREQGFDERTVLVADNEFSWQTLLEATQSLSLFSARQLIELELPTGKPGSEGSKTLQQVAPLLGEDTLLVVHGPKIGKDVQKSKWFKTLDEHGIHSLCYPLEGKPLMAWIGNQLNVAGVAVSPQGARLIADFCEGNLMAARQEIDKLALLYPGQQVDDAALERAIVDQSRYNVFQLVDVMLEGNAQRCIKMLYRLESEGLEPNIVIWALIREWQTLTNLVTARESQGSIQWQRHGIWRNRQGFYESALQRLDKARLSEIREALSQADHLFKQEAVTRPYVKLCHLCMLFLGMPVNTLPVAEA